MNVFAFSLPVVGDVSENVIDTIFETCRNFGLDSRFVAAVGAFIVALIARSITSKIYARFTAPVQKKIGVLADQLMTMLGTTGINWELTTDGNALFDGGRRTDTANMTLITPNKSYKRLRVALGSRAVEDKLDKAEKKLIWNKANECMAQLRENKQLNELSEFVETLGSRLDEVTPMLVAEPIDVFGRDVVRRTVTAPRTVARSVTMDEAASEAAEAPAAPPPPKPVTKPVGDAEARLTAAFEAWKKTHMNR